MPSYRGEGIRGNAVGASYAAIILLYIGHGVLRNAIRQEEEKTWTIRFLSEGPRARGEAAQESSQGTKPVRALDEEHRRAAGAKRV